MGNQYAGEKSPGILFKGNMVNKKKKSMIVASVNILDADKMSVKGRREIATWLRKTANDLVKLGEQYSGKFKASYWCEK